MDLITKEEAAKLMCMSMDTLGDLIRARKIPFYQISPRITRLDRDDCIRFLENARVNVLPEIQKTSRRRYNDRPCPYVPGMEVV